MKAHENPFLTESSTVFHERVFLPVPTPVLDETAGETVCSKCAYVLDSSMEQPGKNENYSMFATATPLIRYVFIISTLYNYMINIDIIANELVRLVEIEIAKCDAIDCVLGGSFAKGTDTDGADVDLFVRFPVSLTDDEFREQTISLGREALAGHQHYAKYADQPYVEGFIDGVRVNIVGVFDVPKGEYRSAADRSIYHVEYVKSHLTDSQKDDVRRLKTTLKEIGVYGANMTVHGFSGYSTEVLVDALGSYDDVLSYFADLKRGQVINGKTSAADTYVTIYDPIDGNRNLAAAISRASLDKLVLHARGTTLSSGTLHGIVVDLSSTRAENEDNQTGKRQRALKNIATRFRQAGFTVLYTELDGSVGTIYLESLTISGHELVAGPLLENRAASDGFIGARSSDAVYVHDGRLYA